MNLNILAHASLVIFIVIILVAFLTIVIIPAGFKGVLLTWGATTYDIALDPGIHFVMPIAQSVVQMDARTQKYEVDASAATKDLLDVTTKVAVNYHVAEDQVTDIYKTVGIGYESTIIAPAVQETVKAITAKYNAEELITHREVVKTQLEAALKERLALRYILVETISLTDFSFPEQFNQAIIDKQTAVQLKLKAENDLERIKVEASQAAAKASGEAQAIEIINEQLLKSPSFLQYMSIQKWNGVLPLATGSGGMPFLIPIPTSSQQLQEVYSVSGPV